MNFSNQHRLKPPEINSFNNTDNKENSKKNPF